MLDGAHNEKSVKLLESASCCMMSMKAQLYIMYMYGKQDLLTLRIFPMERVQYLDVEQWVDPAQYCVNTPLFVCLFVSAYFQSQGLSILL